MIDYDSFSHCHLTDIFFATFAGAKELSMHKINSITTSNTHIQLKHSANNTHNTAQLIHHATKIISRHIILSRNVLYSIIVPL